LDKPLITALLIFHDILATALLVAITGQAVAALCARDVARLFRRPIPYAGEGLQNIITALVIAMVCLGALLYPSYRLVVKPYLEVHDLRAANGAFEIKEHFAALLLLALPAYRESWKAPSRENRTARLVLTVILCLLVWWNFAVGHMMNSIAVLFS
jgi:hypothetical protein